MNLRSWVTCGAFAMAVLLPGGLARSAGPAADTATVLSKLHHSNQMEIEAGKLAQERGQSKDVKSFGKTLVTDHTAADKKVLALAKTEKIDLPAETGKGDMMDKLKSASGPDFDRTFAARMLDDHQNDVAEAKEARDRTSDAKLKALLGAIIPVLEKHREIAQKLVDKLGPSASAAGTNTSTVPR
jgi:putative membrane protein